MSRFDLAFEQQVLRAFKSLSAPPKRVLMALSGGLDSMVMAEVLRKWSRGLGLELAVAHVHHGPASTKRQTRYRTKAQDFVADWAAKHRFKFFTNTSSPPQMLKSEAEWREWRETLFAQWRQGFDAVALAHHQDDLLETRLIRLIRGSGAQGLRAMSPHARGRFRPLLHIAQSEIRRYAEVRELTWVEDPSNREELALRNWLRHSWLPALETRRPGSGRRLARSLENLVPEMAREQTQFELAPYVGLRRDWLRSQNPRVQSEILARYLKAIGLKGYGQTHVREIQKRLQTHSDVEFEMLGFVFKSAHDFLWASRV